jgi:hypothetical protein
VLDLTAAEELLAGRSHQALACYHSYRSSSASSLPAARGLRQLRAPCRHGRHHQPRCPQCLRMGCSVAPVWRGRRAHPRRCSSGNVNNILPQEAAAVCSARHHRRLVSAPTVALALTHDCSLTRTTLSLCL